MAEKRTDAERRLRQCERFSRLLRVLNCIAGPGRWDAEALAAELECSRRTVHRLLQTLSMAGIPWFFDEATKAYKLRPGFRVAWLTAPDSTQPSGERSTLLAEVNQALAEAEATVARLRELSHRLEST